MILVAKIDAVEPGGEHLHACPNLGGGIKLDRPFVILSCHIRIFVGTGLCTADVLPARLRAFEEIACQAELHDRRLPIADAQNSGLHEGPSSVIELMAVSPS